MKDTLEGFLWLSLTVVISYAMGLAITFCFFAITLVEGNLLMALFSNIGIVCQLFETGMVWFFFIYPTCFCP